MNNEPNEKFDKYVIDNLEDGDWNARKIYEAGYAQAMKELSEVEPVAWEAKIAHTNWKGGGVRYDTESALFKYKPSESAKDVVALIPRPKGTNHVE